MGNLSQVRNHPTRLRCATYDLVEPFGRSRGNRGALLAELGVLYERDAVDFDWTAAVLTRPDEILEIREEYVSTTERPRVADALLQAEELPARDDAGLTSTGATTTSDRLLSSGSEERPTMATSGKSPSRPAGFVTASLLGRAWPANSASRFLMAG